MKPQVTSKILFALVGLFLTGQVLAAVPALDYIGKPADLYCRPVANPAGAENTRERVLHYDKIVFAITGPLKAENQEEQKRLDQIPHNTELDIKVKDNPRRVADIKSKVLTFLGAIAKPEYYQAIRIFSVEYSATVCN